MMVRDCGPVREGVDGGRRCHEWEACGEDAGRAAGGGARGGKGDGGEAGSAEEDRAADEDAPGGEEDELRGESAGRVKVADSCSKSSDASASASSMSSASASSLEASLRSNSLSNSYVGSPVMLLFRPKYSPYQFVVSHRNPCISAEIHITVTEGGVRARSELRGAGCNIERTWRDRSG